MRKLVGASVSFLLASAVGCRSQESCFAQCDNGKECVLCNEDGCWPVEPDGKPVSSPYAECTAWCTERGCVVCDHGDCVRVHLAPAPADDDPPVDDVEGGDGGTGCSGDCGGDPDPALLCDGDSECGGGRCLSGRCYAPCETTLACGTGQVCQAGFCADDPTPTPACVLSDDCGGASACIDGTCYAACLVDADCANSADFCDRGLCRPDWRIVTECSSNAGCAAAEECVDGQCRTACWSDADCVDCPDGPRCALGYCGP